MARQLGYGGLANTNGARDFTAKQAATPDAGSYTSRWFFRVLVLLMVH